MKLIITLSLLLAVLVPGADAVASVENQLAQLRTEAANAPDATQAKVQLLIEDYETAKRYYDLAYVHIVYAEALRAGGLDVEAFEVIEQGIKYAQVSEARRAEISLRLLALEHHSIRGRKEEAKQHLDTALKLARTVKDNDLLIETQVAEAQFAAEAQQLEKALSILQRVESEYYSSTPRVAYIFHSVKGEIHRLSGSFEIAKTEMEEALRLAQEAGLWYLSVQYYNLGLVHEALGQTKLARANYQQSQAIAEQLDDEVGIAYAVSAIGLLHYYTGDYKEFRLSYEKALPAFVKSNLRPLEAWMHLGIAEALILEDKPDQASPNLTEAEAIIAELDDIDLRANLAYTQAQYATARGEHEQALSFYQDYAQLDRERQNQASKSSITELISNIESREAFAIAQRDEAQQALEEAVIQRNYAFKWFALSVAMAVAAFVFAVIFATMLNRKYQRKLKLLERTDPLTQLPNRKAVNVMAQKMITKALVHKQPFALSLIQLDGIKQVNNQLGHDAGDDLLKLFSDLCKDLLGENHIMGRVNGTQWLILLSQFDESEAADLFQQMNTELQKRYVSKDKSRSYITSYMGYAQLDLDGESFRNLFERCETALLHAQQTGPKSIQVAPMPKRLPG